MADIPPRLLIAYGRALASAFPEWSAGYADSGEQGWYGIVRVTDEELAATEAASWGRLMRAHVCNARDSAQGMAGESGVKLIGHPRIRPDAGFWRIEDGKMLDTIGPQVHWVMPTGSGYLGYLCWPHKPPQESEDE